MRQRIACGATPAESCVGEVVDCEGAHVGALDSCDRYGCIPAYPSGMGAPDVDLVFTREGIELFVQLPQARVETRGGLTLEGAPLPPDSTFLLGTDLLGRDLLSRLLYGALKGPVWLPHGTRGDFADFSGGRPSSSHQASRARPITAPNSGPTSGLVRKSRRRPAPPPAA